MVPVTWANPVVDVAKSAATTSADRMHINTSRSNPSKTITTTNAKPWQRASRISVLMPVGLNAHNDDRNDDGTRSLMKPIRYAGAVRSGAVRNDVWLSRSEGYSTLPLPEWDAASAMSVS